MPELPEVETIKKGLEGLICNKNIVALDILNEKSFIGNKNSILNLPVQDIERRAKNIRIRLSHGQNLFIHLKMTGQLIYIDNKMRFAGGHPSHDWHDKLPNKHTRLIFHFNDDTKLFFNDLRKFGWCKVMSDQEIDEYYTRFGPEPFSKQFTIAHLVTLAKRFPERTVKQFIMDQSILAGVGNIYADESLFLAKIMPKTKVKFLSERDFSILREKIIEVLKMGVKYGGTTDSDYVDVLGKSGGMQDHLNVYHKTGNNCTNNCGGKIERIVVGGRGTNYCPKCQIEVTE